MLKAALVPQQLTPLLQDAACQVDGISRLLLPVTQSRRGTQTNASSMCLLYCFAYSQELVELRATREGSGKKAPVSVLCRKQQGGTTNLFDSNKKGSQVFWWYESAAVPECVSVQRLNVCCPLKTMYQLSQQHVHGNLFLKCKPLADNMNILNFPHFERQNSKKKKQPCYYTFLQKHTNICAKDQMYSVHSWNTLVAKVRLSGDDTCVRPVGSQHGLGE